ncbi:unnamed protein product [Caenorhabditis brenneri]
MAQLNQSAMLMFDKEDERINDVCMHLSLHSEYFNSMFNGEFPEANKKEINLNDPQTPKDFHLFLLIINGLRPFDEFDDEAVTRVLALSNLWIAKIASGICLDHLLKSEKSTVKDKYVLSDAYKLEDYKEQLIANLKTKEELASIVQNDQIKLDQATKDKLFQKSLELLGIPKAPEQAPNPPTRHRNQHIRELEEEMRRFDAQRDAQERELERLRQEAQRRMDELNQQIRNVPQERIRLAIRRPPRQIVNHQLGGRERVRQILQPREGERRRREAPMRGGEPPRQRQRFE